MCVLGKFDKNIHPSVPTFRISQWMRIKESADDDVQIFLGLSSSSQCSRNVAMPKAKNPSEASRNRGHP